MLASSLPLLSLSDSNYGYHTPARTCSIDYKKQEVEMCVPELSTECTSEKVSKDSKHMQYYAVHPKPLEST